MFPNSELNELNITHTKPKRSNVLVLDGGGVRGLSSLLILQALMNQINSTVRKFNTSYGELHPYNVFQLVAGTSTGGLIALMFGIMGLTVDDCIRQYEELSEVIFGKHQWIGRLPRGLANARYSGKGLRNCVRKLLRERGFDEDHYMDHKGGKTACAVVCREHSTPSQYSTLMKKPVPICSLPCDNKLSCKVCDAARATSAAPTYFPALKIGKRLFRDGGLGHNNPSFAIYFHYTSDERKKATRRPRSDAPSYSQHPPFDGSSVRFINIGTGAKHDDSTPGKRDQFANLIPGTIRRIIFLEKTLKEIAVNSQNMVDFMGEMASLESSPFGYERFDADTGVSNIELDRFDALQEIREKTQMYLDKKSTKDHIEEVGNAIANDYHCLQLKNQHNDQSQQLVVDQTGQSLLAVPVFSSDSSSASVTQSNNSSDFPENVTHIVDPKCDNSRENGPGTVIEHGGIKLLAVKVPTNPLDAPLE